MAEWHLEKYLTYIRNTGRVPLPVEMFDEDWEPIGPAVRRQLLAAGLISVEADGIRLTTQQPDDEETTHAG